MSITLAHSGSMLVSTTIIDFIPRCAAAWPATTTNVPLAGTGAGTEVLEASWKGGAYVTLTGLAWAGSNWTATFPGQARGDGTLIVRDANNHATTAQAELAIGEPFAVAGDSTVVSHGNEAYLSSATPIYVWYVAENCWLDHREIEGTCFQWLYLAEQVRAKTAGPVFLIVDGESGSQVLTDWQPGNTIYNAFTARCLGVGLDAFRFVAFMAGINDAGVSGSITESSMIAGFTATAAGFVADLPGAPLTFACIFGDRAFSDYTGETDAAYVLHFNAIRQGVIGATIRVGGNLTGEEPADHHHPDTDAICRDIGYRFYAAIKPVLYGGTNLAHGPRPAAVYRLSALTLDVSLDQSLSNAVNDAMVGFSAYDNGTAVTVSSQTVVGSQRVRLLLSAPLAGTATVSFANGREAAPNSPGINTTTLPMGVSLALDETARDASIRLPGEPFFAREAVAAPVDQGVRAFRM